MKLTEEQINSLYKLGYFRHGSAEDEENPDWYVKTEGRGVEIFTRSESSENMPNDCIVVGFWRSSRFTIQLFKDFYEAVAYAEISL